MAFFREFLANFELVLGNIPRSNHTPSISEWISQKQINVIYMLVLLSSFLATHEIDSQFRSGPSEFYLHGGPNNSSWASQTNVGPSHFVRSLVPQLPFRIQLSTNRQSVFCFGSNIGGPLEGQLALGSHGPAHKYHAYRDGKS